MQSTVARPHSTPSETLARLHAAYREIRRATEALCSGLSAEDCALQSMPDASPVKWHLAHTSWFFETFLLEPGLPGYRPFHPRFKVLYNSYYVGVGERHPRPERGLLSRPSFDDVLAYRAHVDTHVARWADAARADEASLQVFELGLHHEQQHQELIVTDVKHLLSKNPLRPAYVPAQAAAPAEPGRAEWIAFPAGLREIGHAGERFCFDNEQPRHRVYLGDFALAGRLVTNGEYLAFVDDGGYRRPELWLSEGWDTCVAQRWAAPLYWEHVNGHWQTFTASGMQGLALDRPVCHVSYYEADAFARWAGARLPTEAEWETAAATLPLAGNFAESRRFEPVASPAARGLRQMFGDAWEWTASAYLGYPGYRPAAGAVGEYNGKFMVNQFVLRGGSCATPQSHIRASYRNFFPPAARWQFSGIRLARDHRS
jgi:ergothioneine biosynthesis protein EgtB